MWEEIMSGSRDDTKNNWVLQGGGVDEKREESTSPESQGKLQNGERRKYRRGKGRATSRVRGKH